MAISTVLEATQSADHIKKNLSSDLLDDSDITTTKPFENFFGTFTGNLQRQVCKDSVKCQMIW